MTGRRAFLGGLLAAAAGACARFWPVPEAPRPTGPLRYEGRGYSFFVWDDSSGVPPPLTNSNVTHEGFASVPSLRAEFAEALEELRRMTDDGRGAT